jgi:hypothetical protein
MRRAESLQHGRCRRSIGRGDDGAERDRRRPAQARYELARDDGHGNDREGNDYQRKHDQRPDVLLQVTR